MFLYTNNYFIWYPIPYLCDIRTYIVYMHVYLSICLQSKIRPSSIDILKLGGQMDVNDFTEEAEGTIISVVYAPPDEENPLLAENI